MRTKRAAIRVRKRFVRGVQCAGAFMRFVRTAVDVGVELLGQDSVRGAHLVVGATPMKAERRVMVWEWIRQRGGG